MMNFTELTAKEYAQEQSGTIVIRTYENGCSNDERRKTTKPERKIIESIIFGGLLAIREGEKTEKEIQAIINSCEFIAKIQLPEMNGYDSIYNPMKDFVKDNK